METYLMHHGIKGQKWGIRRYQNEDGSLTPAGKKRYYNVIDRNASYYNHMGKAINSRIEGIRKSVTDSKASTGKKAINAISYAVGNKGRASDSRIAAEYHKDLAGHARTKFGKKLNETRAKNDIELSKYYEKASNRTLGERYVAANFFDSDAFNTPYHRMSGRTTTRGKEALNYMFTFGIAGLVGDAAYKSKQKKAKSGN